MSKIPRNIETWAAIYEQYQSGVPMYVLAIQEGVTLETISRNIRQLERYGLSGSFLPTGAVHRFNCKKYGCSRPEIMGIQK